MDSLEQESVELSMNLAIAHQELFNIINEYNSLHDEYMKLKTALPAYEPVPDGGLQALLDSHSVGDIVNIPPGEYRLTKPLQPKTGQTLLFNGATIKGSVTVGTWEKGTDGFYVATVAIPVYVDNGVCEIISGPDANGCRVLEDVFNGGKKLTRVMQKANLGPGKVYTDAAMQKVYIADVPDNVEVALTRFFMNSDTDGVRVSGANVSQFASPSQQGALVISGQDWEVDNCFFSQNHSSGLHVTGADGVWIHHNTFEANGQAGMTHHRTVGSVIEDNIFRGNNTNDYYRRDWESAGLKVTYSTNVLIRDNLSESNLGVGIWCDIDNIDISILNNNVRDNFSCGIRYEISFDGEISGNKLDGNGFGHAGPGRGSDYSGFATAAIHVNSAGGKDDGSLIIKNNILGKNQNGIHVEERGRGKSVTYPTYNWAARNVKVLNNKIDLTQASQGYGTGVVGLGTLGTVVSDVYNAGNIFEGNQYLTPNISQAQFHCKDTTVNQYRGFARWQALGYDKTGSITVV